MTSIALTNTSVPVAVIYPSAIARACTALDETPFFRDMPDGYLRVVTRIIKKINLHHLKSPIVASRLTLARESGKSLETVHRAVKWLEDHLLVQRQQKARRGLRGSSSPLIPTDTLLIALQLTGVHSSTQEPPLTQDNKTGLLPVLPDSSISMNLKNTVSIREQPETGFLRIDGFAIPSELVWLCNQNDLKATALLGLMKLAKKVNQRLADVVTVAKQYIQNIKGRELYAYLHKLICADKDYRHIAQVTAQGVQTIQMRARLEQKSRELQGRRFTNRAGTLFVTVERDGMLSEVRDGQEGVCPMTAEFLNALDDGRLFVIS